MKKDKYILIIKMKKKLKKNSFFNKTNVKFKNYLFPGNYRKIFSSQYKLICFDSSFRLSRTLLNEKYS